MRAAEGAARWGAVCRRLGTLSTADVSGFTQLEIRLNATGRGGIEAFAEAMQSVFEMLCDMVKSESGSVVEFAGDALICLFEAKDGKDEDEARRNALRRQCRRW